MSRAGGTWLLVAVWACGRFGYDPELAGDLDAAVEGEVVDAGPGGGADGAAACSFGPWSPPERVDGIDVAPPLFGPAPSADGLTLVFSRLGLPGVPLTEDLYVATRPSRDAPFEAAVPLGELNTIQQDGTPFLRADTELWFSSSRGGLLNDMDIWVATRAGPGEPFGEPARVAEVSSAARDYLPSLPADGLTVFFASSRQDAQGEDDLWMATRPEVTAPFSEPVRLSSLNTNRSDTSPFVSPDGLTLYLASNRNGGLGGLDLYVATRSDPGAPFDEPPLPIEGVSSPSSDEDPAVTADGLELFFASNRDGAFRLWRSTRSCE